MGINAGEGCRQNLELTAWPPRDARAHSHRMLLEHRGGIQAQVAQEVGTADDADVSGSMLRRPGIGGVIGCPPTSHGRNPRGHACSRDFVGAGPGRVLVGGG